MTVHRLFIFWTNPLFYETVRLLLSHPQIEWVGSSSSYATAGELVATSLPDTILVEEVNGNLPPEMMKVLEFSVEGLRVVSLSLEDNQMRTYHRVEKTVGKAEDLLQWVLNDSKQGE